MNGKTRTQRIPRARDKWGWDGVAEMELMRHLCRENFWTFFLYAFGAGLNSKGQKWIDPSIHRPLADWYEKHIREWMEWRRLGLKRQKHLAIIIHREMGKTTLVNRAGQLWLHLLDPEIATAIGSEKVDLSVKMLDAMKSVFDGSDSSALWTLLYGNWFEDARKWTGREIVHSGRKNTSRQDPSIVTFGVETSITGSHPDALFYDDPISYERLSTDTNWLASVNSQVSSLIPVIQGDGLIVWVGCMAVGSPVLMADGTWRPIEQVSAGDSVYTTDENGAAAVRVVEASLDQGVSETVTVTSKCGSVRCTPWHPFLVADGKRLSWVRADALRPKDLVVTLKSSPSDPELPWMTDDLSWLCGIIMGDGWIGKNGHYACIALSKDDELTERIISVLEDWIPGSLFHRTAFGYLRCNSHAAADAFRSLGLVGSAKTKRIPSWVFRAEQAQRVAFLKGLCEADGHKTTRGTDSWSVELSNAELIADARLLARSCGVRVGMERPTRIRTVKAPNSREATVSVTSGSSFNFATVGSREWPENKDASGEYRWASKLASVLGDTFRLDRVVSVVPAGRCPVWDLTVAGSRSFVCNGYVVHNTRYDAEDHFGKAFSTLGVRSLEGMETDSIMTEPEGSIDVYFLAGRDAKNTTNYPEGEPTSPLVWPHDRMKRYQKTDPLRYAAQVMNDPNISELNPITKDQIEQCMVSKKDVPWSALRFAVCCDTAFSDGNRISAKDETVLVVHGYPRNGSGDVYVIEAYGNASMRAEDFGKLIVTTVQRYRRNGFKIIAITDEKTRAGKKGSWELNLKNYFSDVNEPMPRFIEFERGVTRKYERLHSAAMFWVDGHVRVIRDAPGVNRLCEQMARIGQYAVNPRIKIDFADAHSDAFQPELYQPMRRAGNQQSPWDRGSTAIETEGMRYSDFEDDDLRQWAGNMPREPIR